MFRRPTPAISRRLETRPTHPRISRILFWAEELRLLLFAEIVYRLVRVDLRRDAKRRAVASSRISCIGFAEFAVAVKIDSS